MQLEFHQLDRRWEHLRVRHPGRQRRLLASLADSGQQTPIVVVAAEGQADRFVVIDGYKRIVALEQLGRDTVEAVVWPMSEAAAVLLDRSLRLSEHETADCGGLAAPSESACHPPHFPRLNPKNPKRQNLAPKLARSTVTKNPNKFWTQKTLQTQ